MSDSFVDRAKEGMGAVERLLKGLPGIRGYIDKELRRDADKQVRELIARTLDEQKQALVKIQQKLLGAGGLKWMDDVESIIVKVQTLADRVRTASYGYAGLFDAQRIREEQLDALRRFDEGLARRVAGLESGVSALAGAVTENEQVGAVLEQISAGVDEVTALFNRRREAIIAPDLLTSDYAPNDEVAAGDAPAGEMPAAASDMPAAGSEESGAASEDSEDRRNADRWSDAVG